MLIRSADAHRDASACAAIYAPFVRDTVVSLEEEAPDATEMSARIERTFESYPWLVAEDASGIVIGYAYATRHRDRAAYRWAAEVTVYVAADARRQGVASALYGRLLPLMRDQGLRVALAVITLPNHASVALHEKFGFQLVGVYAAVGFKFGQWCDVGWWQAKLDDGRKDPPTELIPPSELIPPPR